MKDESEEREKIDRNIEREGERGEGEEGGGGGDGR